jgi:hypothetical protein
MIMIFPAIETNFVQNEEARATLLEHGRSVSDLEIPPNNY